MRALNRQKGDLSLPVFLGFGLALLLLSGIAVIAEARPFVASAGTDANRLQAIYANNLTGGLSQSSGRKVLDSCSVAATSIAARLQEPERRIMVLSHCRMQTDALVQTMPTYGLAWFVGALLAAEQEDFPTMNTYLTRAYAVAPYELWIGALRVRLAEKFHDRLDANYRTLHRRDLAMMVASARGIDIIADRWVRDADFRSRIAKIVATLPEKNQAAFIRRIGVAATGFGG